MTKCHETYEVSRWIGRVTYELYMPERVKEYQTFHVNFLKEVQVHQEPVYSLFVCAVQAEEVSEKFFFLKAQESPVQ